MSFAVRLMAVWSICLSSLYAQDYSHTIEGNYPLTSQSFSPIKIGFTLSWNETGNRVDGVYSDNYFATSAPVTGTTTNKGRILNVAFAEPTQGIKSINLTMPQIGLFNGQAAVQITTTNAAGVPFDAGNIVTNMSSRVLNPVNAGARPCIVGFGVFSGFCGQFAGTISEVSDPKNRCNLIGKGITKLEMAHNTEIKLFQNVENNNLKGRVPHMLGRLPASPLSPNVNMTNRICGLVENTTFPQTGCKVLNLTGAFQEVGDTPNFTGTYSISDESTRATCRYSLNLFRDVAY